MNKTLILVASLWGVISISPLSAQPIPPTTGERHILTRYMGEQSCGYWLSLQTLAYTNEIKSLVLNWELGFLSGIAIESNVDLLRTVDQASVAAWLDEYCHAHPLDLLTNAGLALSLELNKRQRREP
jgi:hypothetical protein